MLLVSRPDYDRFRHYAENIRLVVTSLKIDARCNELIVGSESQAAILPTMRRRPAWLEWDIALSVHLLERMEDRGFSELDLRAMFLRVTSIRRDAAPERWVLCTHFGTRRWENVVQPEAQDELLWVVTAYPTS
jgi:hypothetical protein